MPRYESGKVYGASRRSSGSAKGVSGRSSSGDGRRVRAGKPLGERRSRGQPPDSRRRRRAAARRPPRWLSAALWVLAVGGLLVVGGYSTLKTLVLSQLVGVVVSREGQVEQLATGQGFIIRHETLLRSPVTGRVSLSLSEGARVRKDGEVVSLADTEEKEQAEARVAQLETELVAFNGRSAGEEATLAGTLASTEAGTLVQAESLRRACLGSDFTVIDRVSSQLAVAVQRESEAAARLVTIRKDRAALEAALATARAALGQSVFPVLASEAGLVSYYLDGMEETLTPESIGQYQTREILAMIRGEAATVNQTVVQAGEPVAKIIGDTEVYVAAILTNSRADELGPVKDVILRFPAFEGRREAKASLFHVGQRERNGYCLVTYRLQELLPGMISVRETDVTVVVHVWSGVVLPKKAIVHRGGQDGVFVRDVTVCRFRPVEVLGGDGKDIVVDGLPAGMEVISTPWLVGEGTRIGRQKSREGLTAAGPNREDGPRSA